MVLNTRASITTHFSQAQKHRLYPELHADHSPVQGDPLGTSHLRMTDCMLLPVIFTEIPCLVYLLSKNLLRA